MSTHLLRVSTVPTAAAAKSCSFLQSVPAVALLPALNAFSLVKMRQLRRPAQVFFATSGSSGNPVPRNSMRSPQAGKATAGAVSTDLRSLLESVEVFGLDGKAVPLLDLWSERKAVVGFARHFGCVLCRKRADELASKKDEMDAAGVALVLIGPGSVEQAKVFAEQTGFKGEVYADPVHASFEALNFVSGVTTTFTPAAGLKIIKLYMEGYRQDWELSFEKNTRERGGWQQGGTLVAGPGKSNILYLRKDKEAGDDPDLEEVLAACCKDLN